MIDDYATIEAYQVELARSNPPSLPATIPTGSLLAYYPLNNNLLNEVDFPLTSSYNMTGVNSPSYKAGKIGNALAIVTGSSAEYAYIPDSDVFSFTDGAGTDEPFSVSCWIYSEVGDNRGWFISKRDTSGNNEYNLANNNGTMTFLCFSGGGSGTYIARGPTSFTMPTAQWVHICGTYDGSETGSGINFYVDGVLDTDNDVSTGTYAGMSNTISDVVIGVAGFAPVDNTQGYGFTGEIDLVSIWDKELSAAEVTLIYNKESGSEYLIPIDNGHTSANDVYSPRAGARFSADSTDISDWSIVGTGYRESNTNTTYVRSGTTSLLVSGSTTGQEGALIYDPSIISGSSIGDIVTISGWANISTTASADPMEVRIYHQSYGSSAIATLDQGIVDEWQYFTLTKERLDGTLFVITLKSSDGIVYFDDVSVRVD